LTLKPRQERILRAVVEEYIATGSPVGSRYLSIACDFGVASSTIRNDLSELEEDGLLAHPHTSAGRVPTDAGYRHYVDAIMHDRREQPQPPALAVDHEQAKAELDEALRETADALSRVTAMLAVVSTPSFSSTSIRHIEVLLLQPRLVMVVVITSSGSVGKRVFRFDSPLDEGLIEFARVYLNERLAGAQVGGRLIDSAFASPDLHQRERAFLDVIQPAFKLTERVGPEGLHLGGAPRLVEALALQGVPNLDGLLQMLEERYNLLELLYDALRQDDVYLRIGHEMAAPSLQACSLVAASYGVASRNLGTVSVLGPTRMDYQRVIAAVRASADGLSDLLEEIW
jgi:heat-inducible transcriptional repressor